MVVVGMDVVVCVVVVVVVVVGASRIEPVVSNREKTHRGIQDGYQKDSE